VTLALALQLLPWLASKHNYRQRCDTLGIWQDRADMKSSMHPAAMSVISHEIEALPANHWHSTESWHCAQEKKRLATLLNGHLPNVRYG